MTTMRLCSRESTTAKSRLKFSANFPQVVCKLPLSFLNFAVAAWIDIIELCFSHRDPNMIVAVCPSNEELPGNLAFYTSMITSERESDRYENLYDCTKIHNVKV